MLFIVAVCKKIGSDIDILLTNINDKLIKPSKSQNKLGGGKGNKNLNLCYSKSSDLENGIFNLDNYLDVYFETILKGEEISITKFLDLLVSNFYLPCRLENNIVTKNYTSLLIGFKSVLLDDKDISYPKLYDVINGDLFITAIELRVAIKNKIKNSLMHEVIDKLDYDELRKFLRFTTGSQNVPNTDIKIAVKNRVKII